MTGSYPSVRSLTIGARIRWALMDTATLARRDMIRTARQPEMVSFAVVMGVFFLLLFNYVFGGTIEAGTGIDYVQFLVPGMLLITTLTGAQQTGTGLAEDLAERVTDRFRSLPMSQVAVIAGRTIADTIRNAIGVLLVVGVGYLLGFRFASWAGALGVLALAVGLGYCFSWINAAIAAKVRNAEMVGMLSMFWLFPLMFASSLFTPTDAMPRWLKAFADHQPMSVTADAVRALSDGRPAGSESLQAVIWIVVLLAVFIPLSTRLYRKA